MSRRPQEFARIVLVFLMALLTFLLLGGIHRIGNNVRVLNDVATLRGESQILVKEEMEGNWDDELLSRLDSVLEHLKTRQCSNFFLQMHGADYDNKLKIQDKLWQSLKQQITAFRGDQSKARALYDVSGAYFNAAEDTLSSAEEAVYISSRIIETVELLDLLILIAIVVLYSLELRAMKQLSRKNRQLDILAHRDGLTGLSNRVSCIERLANPLAIDANIQVACFMFDLNNLKVTNDHWGHQAGDRLLSCFASALKKAAPAHAFVGRYGGDEFISVIAGMNRPAAEAFVARIKENAARADMRDCPIQISFATGIAMSGDYPGYNIEELMSKADEAMYYNKEQMKKNDPTLCRGAIPKSAQQVVES